MPLYPTLEDLNFDNLAQAQQYKPVTATTTTTQLPPPSSAPSSSTAPPAYPAPGAFPHGGSTLYPSLGEFMGLDVSHQNIKSIMPEHVGHEVIRSSTVASGAAGTGVVVAPITGSENMGVLRAEVQQGVRPVVLCKDNDGKVGIRVQHVDKGVFVSLVACNSPAAMAGLRFGDQLLQINGETIAGYDRSKVMGLIKKAAGERITFAVRDRPFERTITLQKDSTGHVGFIFKDGKITKIVEDSSAARNGLLTEHNLLEINGQNVVGLKDKERLEILRTSGGSVTLTIIPSFIYEHMVKCMKESLIRREMDHSIPDV